MWKWECELRQMGLRPQSRRYWKCERRYGLPNGAYLSIFANALDREFTRNYSRRLRVDIGAFHVTFHLGFDNIHFYYHETAEDLWEPGGHTSAEEIRHHHREPHELRQLADEIASAFLTAAGARLLPRDARKNL